MHFLLNCLNLYLFIDLSVWSIHHDILQSRSLCAAIRRMDKIFLFSSNESEKTPETDFINLVTSALLVAYCIVSSFLANLFFFCLIHCKLFKEINFLFNSSSYLIFKFKI